MLRPYPTTALTRKQKWKMLLSSLTLWLVQPTLSWSGAQRLSGSSPSRLIDIH